MKNRGNSWVYQVMNSTVSGLTLPTYQHCCIIMWYKFNFCVVVFLIYPDPSLTVEAVLGVMEKVTDGRAEEVWRRLFWRNIILGDDLFEDISSKCSTKRELMHTCADIYVNCDPDSSWEWIACRLYHCEETAAVEEVQSYLNPRGRFSRWVWFV